MRIRHPLYYPLIGILMCSFLIPLSACRATVTKSAPQHHAEQTSNGASSKTDAKKDQASPSPTTAASATPKTVQAKPQWFACRQDTDCAIQQGPCAEPQAVNKGFISAFLNYRDQMNTLMECKANDDFKPKQHAYCGALRCRVKE